MTFSIKKALKETWGMFFSKKIYLPFVLTSLVSVLGIYVAFGVGGVAVSFFLFKGLWMLLIPLVAILAFVVSYFILTSIFLPLSTYNSGKVEFRKVFTSVWDYKLIAKTAGLIALLVGSILVAGYVLAMLGAKISPILIPVVIAVVVAVIAVRFAFSLYILVETKSGVISSLKKSHEMMKGNGWKFLIFILVVGLISFAVQILTTGVALVSPILAQAITILFGVVIAPWFSLLAVSPYMQLKK